MLAPPNDFGYSPATHHHAMGGYDHQAHHQQHSGERPKLFMDGGHMQQHGGPMHSGHPGMNDFQHMVNGQHGMTPQHHHHHQGGDFDHEPLMMNMHNPQSHFYPPMGAQMLHVSSDYADSMDGTTPSVRGGNSSKRSREELNLKEKKRMFKLNDRINHLKTVLDEAGVQSKKNKQSILDNTYHYIGMLRSNLLIAKQKAERAEKQAEVFRSQAQKGGNGGSSEADLVFKRCFQQSSTPRLLLDLNMEPVTFNAAFLHQTGLNEDAISGKNPALRAALCLDNNKLESIMKNAKSGNPVSAVVQARAASGITSLTLIMSPMTDDVGKITNIEVSFIPVEISSDPSQQSFHSHVKGEGQEASPSSIGELAL